MYIAQMKEFNPSKAYNGIELKTKLKKVPKS